MSCISLDPVSLASCPEVDGCYGEGQTLLGHSLSWDDPKGRRPPPDSKLVAKIWMPENPTESDLINLAAYSSDY